ncbi:hypothetical protein BH23ACT10_BH23ACT10_10470 [soil metagenome]
MSDDLAWLRTAPPRRISGRSVTLRCWVDDDLDEQLSAIHESMDALTPWMPWADGYTRHDGVEFLTRMRTAWDAGTEFGYAVVDTDDVVLGSVGLHARIGVGGLEIGYWIRSSAQRRGTATRAAALATAAAFDTDGVTHTEIRHDRDNELSGRIPRRLGYRHVDGHGRARDTDGLGHRVALADDGRRVPGQRRRKPGGRRTRRGAVGDRRPARVGRALCRSVAPCAGESHRARRDRAAVDATQRQ